MQDDYFKKLEYNEILDILQGYCKTYIGKNLGTSLLPSNNKDVVTKLLKETTQGLDIITRNGASPIEPINNIEIEIKKLESSTPLTAKSLLDISHILKLSRELKEYFNFDNTTEFDLLESYFSSLYTNKNIEKNILSKILDENTIDDNASPKLSSIRKSQNKLNVDIKNKLKSIIYSNTYSKYLQESIITIRNDRFVIPVKEEFRGQIKGFVHDVSSSKSTLFIEPLPVFELNNELNNLKTEEAIEIEKILANLSNLLSPITKELNSNIQIIGKLDFIFAKANFSKDILGVEPSINQDKYINLVKARHPLIDKQKVVPIDINIGKPFNSLLITGPNTGGKTVLLKTVGLLLLMATSGLHIPASENSSIYVFDNIFVDIGDNQSIVESLSTFSSHMLNIIKILKSVTHHSLVLLDELGSGTDPKEGSMLAISILDRLYSIDCITISSTHYTELKNYAQMTDGFENASFEFDIENLMPTYKLIIGIPGKSNAFEISQKLGLEENILKRAISLMDTNDISIEELLKSIYDTKLEIEFKENEINKNLNQIEFLRKKLEKDYSDKEEKANILVEKAKKEARDVLFTAKEESSVIIKEMNKILKNSNSNSSSMKDLNNLRNDLNTKIKDLSIANNKENKTTSFLNSDDITIGMNVYVSSLNQEGIVLSSPNDSNEVQVQIGSMKISVDMRNLSIVKNINQNTSKKQSVYKTSSIKKTSNTSPEINVIGLNVEDAVSIIDKYLDDAQIANLESIRIIHGKGTGKLRAGIHSFLKKHPHVKSFRIGTFGEGELGATIVLLK